MEKIVSKGYTLAITSWENDGDDYKTKYKTVDSLEEAKKYNKICKELFVSCNNGKKGVGNSMDKNKKQTLVDYVEKNQELFIDLDEDEDSIWDYFTDLAYKLMGNSEYYDFRVCESVVCTYSEQDVFAKKIDLD